MCQCPTRRLSKATPSKAKCEESRFNLASVVHSPDDHLMTTAMTSRKRARSTIFSLVKILTAILRWYNLIEGFELKDRVVAGVEYCRSFEEGRKGYGWFQCFIGEEFKCYCYWNCEGMAWLFVVHPGLVVARNLLGAVHHSCQQLGPLVR